MKIFQERQQYVDRIEAEKQRKRDASNFLVPPPPGFGNRSALNNYSLSFSNPIVSPTPVWNNHKSLNNLQGSVLLPFNEDNLKEKENSSSFVAAKKKRQPVLAGVDAGMMLYSAMAQPDPSVDMMVKLMAEFQKSYAAAEERCMQKEAVAEENHLKADEQAQHIFMRSGSLLRLLKSCDKIEQKWLIYHLKALDHRRTSPPKNPGIKRVHGSPVASLVNPTINISSPLKRYLCSVIITSRILQCTYNKRSCSLLNLVNERASSSDSSSID